jgi:aryl-alcohol dehydrogenase-like predicted oxidoreductase
MKRKTTRRGLIATGMAVAGGLVGTAILRRKDGEIVAKPTISLPQQPPLPERVLGKTGQSLPIFGLGTAGQTPIDKAGREPEAIAQIEAALKLGIRYFDTAASYGASEEHLGKVLPPYRSQIFLASKTARRDRDGAWRELERSLARLNTDYLDLWQQAMGYVLSLEGVHCCIIAAESVEQLQSNVRVARAFQPLGPEEMAAIENRTAAAWRENTFFRAWT